MPAKAAEKFDAYDVVTETIIKSLEAGTVPWRKPWTADGTLPLSLSSKKPYRGINVWLLSLAAYEGGYSSPYWGTYNNIVTERGGSLKGAKGTRIVLWKSFLKDVKGEDGKIEKKRFFTLRYYSVFNADQAIWPEGSKRPESPVKTVVEHDPIAEAEAVVAGFKNPPQINVRRSDRAFYVPADDTVTVPELAQYEVPEEYYSTFFHELGHSTGHQSRCDRKGIQTFSHFGDEKYSQEELVAEMTAAFLCASVGIEITLDNSAAYIASWLKVLKGDKRLVVTAAAQAQKAADHILGVTFAEAAETEKVAA